MWRIIRGFGVGLMLALLLAAVAMWVRSYSVTDDVRRNWWQVYSSAPGVIQSRYRNWWLRSSMSRVCLTRFTADGEDSGELNERIRLLLGDGRIDWHWDDSHYPVWMTVPAHFRRTQYWGFGYGVHEQNGAFYHSGLVGPYRYRVLIVPWAAIVALLAIAPVLWGWGLARRIRRTRRITRGLCGQCGYDLRESSGLCPECGSVARA